jgi:hypothetical protein
VPFAPPAPHGGLGIVQHACNPSTGGLFSFGYTLVTCGATDQADQSSVASFYVSEEPAPALAPSGPMVADGGWRVVGTDFAPGSTVSVTLDGAALTSAPVDSAGRVDALVTIPRAAPIGDGYLVVAGTDALAHPLYIVTPLTVDAAGHADVVAPVPAGAPAPVTVTVKLPPLAPRAAPPRVLLPGKSVSTHVGSVIPSATGAGIAAGAGTAWWAYLLIALGGAGALALGGAGALSPVLRRRMLAKVRRR